MPELKNTFTGGKMEKDRDERIVGSGLYREALNIEVSTSEDSEVGAAQNILGNIQVTSAIAGPLKDYAAPCKFGDIAKGRYDGTNSHIAHVVDPQNDKLYRFIATDGGSHGVWMDRVVEYNTKSKIEDPWQLKERAVMVDIYKVATTINSVDAGPPTPPTPLFYGCYNGVCTDCSSDPNACNTPGQVIYGEATCGGSCSAAVIPGCMDPLYVDFNPLANLDDGSCLTLIPVVIVPATILKCTDRCDLIPPNEDPLTYAYGNLNTASYPIALEIESNPTFYSLNQALWRYPCWPTNNLGYPNQPLARRYDMMWGLKIIDDATDNNGNLLPFATQSWETNVSGLLYDVVYGGSQSGGIAGSYVYNVVLFHCIEDYITWMNSIPDPTTYLVDGVGTPIGGYTSDKSNNWNVTPVVFGNFGMVQAVTSNIFNNGGWTTYITSSSTSGTSVPPVTYTVRSQACADGVNPMPVNYSPLSC